MLEKILFVLLGFLLFGLTIILSAVYKVYRQYKGSRVLEASKENLCKGPHSWKSPPKQMRA